MRRIGCAAAAAGALLAGCGRADAPASDNPLTRPPVDERVQLADAAQWLHRRTLDADLDGDGTVETIVLAADVTVNRGGEPIWEDGHLWAVFVDDGGRRTLLYGAFVPNGHAEAAVLTADASGNRRHVLIHERTPQQLRTFVVEYDGPGAARGVSAAYYQVERWMPALTK